MKLGCEITTQDARCLAQLVEQRLGLRCDGRELDNCALVMRKRLEATDAGSTQSYLRRLRGNGREELRILASLLTVNESYFFRNREQILGLTQGAIPQLMRKNVARRIRIISAGCACGEEPFTIAIILLEDKRINPSQFSIIGFDVNPECIGRARAGRFSQWPLRAVPEALREKYFHRNSGEFTVNDRIREMVVLEERNLLDSDPGFWQPQSFDVIFCRNVLLYFSRRALDQALRTFARSLKPDGYLFLGHAESLRGISHEFQLEHSHGAFYYRPRCAHAGPASREASAVKRCSSSIEENCCRSGTGYDES